VAPFLWPTVYVCIHVLYVGLCMYGRCHSALLSFCCSRLDQRAAKADVAKLLRPRLKQITALLLVSVLVYGSHRGSWESPPVVTGDERQSSRTADRAFHVQDAVSQLHRQNEYAVTDLSLRRICFAENRDVHPLLDTLRKPPPQCRTPFNV